MRILDIFKNPATGNVSHSKLWANVACAAGTFKFVMLPDPSAEVWAVYLGIVGGYAVARSLVSVKRQEVENESRETAGVTGSRLPSSRLSARAWRCRTIKATRQPFRSSRRSLTRWKKTRRKPCCCRLKTTPANWNRHARKRKNMKSRRTPSAWLWRKNRRKSAV